MANIPNAFGGFLFSSMPQYTSVFGGFGTPFGTVLPPTTRVAAYVLSANPPDGTEQSIVEKIVPTLDAALKRCRAGQGDIIYVLPGHSENVTDATFLDNLVAGTRIIGLGDPNQDMAPTFRWTDTAGEWSVDQDNVEIAGLRLRMEGADGITKAINVTGSGFKMTGCNVQLASGASNKATIGVEIGSGATEAQIVGNYFRGTATHNVTDGIKVVGATTPDDLKVVGNTMIASATAANGLIRVTVAAKRCYIAGNRVQNTHTDSTAAITIGNVAASGIVEDNRLGVEADAADYGLSIGGANECRFFENYGTDEDDASGNLTPAGAT